MGLAFYMALFDVSLSVEPIQKTTILVTDTEEAFGDGERFWCAKVVTRDPSPRPEPYLQQCDKRIVIIIKWVIELLRFFKFWKFKNCLIFRLDGVIFR